MTSKIQQLDTQCRDSIVTISSQMTGINKDEMKYYLELILKYIPKVCKKHGKLQIRNFGTFTYKKSRKQVKSTLTNQNIDLNYEKISFQTSRKVRDKINMKN